jgi:hypothetical protein
MLGRYLALRDADKIEHKFLRQQSAMIESCVTDALFAEPL